MRLLLSLLALLFGTTIATAPLASAQDSPDIAAVAADVMDSDPAGLLSDLETPIPADLLPEGFTEASYVDPDAVSGASPAIDEETAPGVIGTTSYSVIYQQSTGGGSPVSSPEAAPSPQASGPTNLYSTAGLHFVAFDHEFDASTLEDFDQAIMATTGQQATDMEIEEISINDTPAYRFTIQTEINAVPVYMQWVAIPVGNIAVLGMVMLGGQDVDLDALAADAEALALAGIVHLGNTAANETQPAG